MFIVVANWKSQLTFAQVIALCKENIQGFVELGQTNVEIVLCPSFEALSSVAHLFKNTAIKIGAQNCSMYTRGAYTGEVLAASLAEVGSTYCIVGHSERRTNFKEHDLDVALKVERLLEVGIKPIICVGETGSDYDGNKTFEVLERQLEPVFKRLRVYESTQSDLCVAYEPVWAIGTGIVPEKKRLEEVFSWITRTCKLALPSHTFRFLYGGSVTSATSAGIRAIPGVDGLLVGSASLDFQNFQKIVSSS